MNLSSIISFKNINKLAFPALIAGIAEPVLSLTDAAIVGNMDNNATEALAAVGIVTTIISMLVWVFGQTRSAISSIVSQYLGANKFDEVKYLPAQAIVIIVGLSILIVGISFPFTEAIFKLYNAKGLVLDYCIRYYQIRIFGLPFTLFAFAVFGIFRGLQNTYYPMIIAMVGAITNIVLDFIFVYGIENLIPAMHIEGAAYASVIAQVLMAIIAVYLLIKKTAVPLVIKFPLHKELGRLTTMIGNLFIRTIALNVALNLGTAYATSYGDHYIAAYTITFNLWMLGAFAIDGYSSAGNILSGKLLGAKQYHDLAALGKKLVGYGFFTGLTLIILGAVLYFPIGNIFAKELIVRDEFYAVFWIVLAMQPICAITFIFDGVFKGLGEMKFLRNILIFSTLLAFIPTLLLFDYLDYKLHAIWIAFFVWIIARGLPMYINFRRKFPSRLQKD